MTMVTTCKARVLALDMIRTLAYVSAFVFLFGCTRYGTATPPDSTKNIPIYPGANTVISNTTEIGEVRPAQSISFQTSDSKEIVMAFYNDGLLKDGWTVSYRSTPGPSGMRFYWNEGCPTSTMDVSVTMGTGELTNVKVVLMTFGCE
jgi:hypothetical protein